MKILMINPAVEHYYKSITGPMGILAVASYLEKNGHDVKFIDRCVKQTDINKLFDEIKPDIVGITFMSAKVLSDIRKIYNAAHSRNIIVVAGGAMASVLPEMIIEENCADIVIKGEGELTWFELVNAITANSSFDTIDGLCYKKNGIYTENKDREFADLAMFPPINWDLAEDASIYFQSLFGQKRLMYIYTAKGCPGQCTFCFNKAYQKRCYRKRPLNIALKEIKNLIDRHNLDGVHFSDEIWCKNSEEMHQNCKMINESGLEFKWGCNFRIGQLKPEDFKKMYDSGCRWVFFGIESGSEYIHKKMKKGIDLSKVYEQTKACHDAGITPICSFIIGFPGEREEDLKKTCAIIKSIPFAMYDSNFFFPFEGTEMYDELVAEGKYRKTQKLDDLRILEQSEFKLVNSINFSQVPTRDLKVIRSWILWQSFTRKTPKKDGKKELFALKAIKDALKSLFGGGIKHFFFSFKYSADMILNVMFNVFCFPSILKKYGLK